MNTQDIALSCLIVFLFIIIVVWNIVSANLSKIKHNWIKYRCNPMVMPFAEYFGHDPAKNFNQCIETIQKDRMGEYLQPANYAIALAGRTGGQITESVQGIREFLNYLRNQLYLTIRKIFTVFLGIVQPINQILAKFRDLTMRLVGAMTVMLYMVDGSNKTVVSTWNSDVGGMVRTLCFHPNTTVNLKFGRKKFMTDIKLGDILENGTEVVGLLQLKGPDKNNPYYKIWSKELGNYIYVTGSHLIKDPDTKKFIKVSEFKDALPTRKTSQYMSCLITDNHRIPIGEYIFWDWEDDKETLIKYRYSNTNSVYNTF